MHPQVLILPDSEKKNGKDTTIVFPDVMSRAKRLHIGRGRSDLLVGSGSAQGLRTRPR